MFVFRNSLGIGQHNRLMVNAGDIDFTGGGSNNPNPHDAPDINNGKGDKTDLDKPDNKPDDNPDDKPDNKGDNDKPDDKPDGKDNPDNGGSPTGGLEKGSVIEFEGANYTVDDNGNIVDKDGNIFKEAKDVDEWIKQFDVDDKGDDDTNKGITLSSIQKAIGEEIVDEAGKPVEFTDDADGVKSYIDNVIALRSNELQQAAVNKVFTDNPILAQFANYLAVNGSPRGFGEMPDRSGIKVEQDNEQQQIAIIKAAAEEFGNSSLNDNYIKYLKDNGSLYDEAKAQLENLQKADTERNEEYARQAEAQRKQQEEATNAYWNNVHEKLTSRKIGDYQLPESFVREVNGQKVTTNIDDFFNYLYRQTEDKDGQVATAYQRDRMSMTEDEAMNEELISAWLTFTGGSYKDLVDMAVRAEQVKTLQLKAKNNEGRKTIRITKPANANNKINLDDVIF